MAGLSPDPEFPKVAEVTDRTTTGAMAVLFGRVIAYRCRPNSEFKVSKPGINAARGLLAQESL